MASSNILSLPFRRSHRASFADAVKQYISNKYDQHPDMFQKDLEEIDLLRERAINAIEPHPSGIKAIQQYAANLVFMGGKFPIDIGVEFVWYPALGYNAKRPTSENNIRFELSNTLFNLAAMHSQLAVTSNRGTADGLKTAANHFCAAAGVLAHLRTDIIPEMRSAPPEDMDNMTLESLEHLMLAQAQEMFWSKAVKGGLKDASIAKLAVKVSDLYLEAGDFGIKSDAVSSEWIHHMTAKHHHFASAAQYRAACDCLEKRKYGEEVARLRDSLVCVNEALKEARYVTKAVLADLNGLKSRVQEDLRRAEKDNDMIYLVPVPPKSELRLLDRATMVAAKAPKEVSEPLSFLGDGGDWSQHGELGRALFAKLVPFSVHVAASIYAERRDRLISQNIVDQLEGLTAQIHDVLRSLNLPGSLQALEKPLGLPPSLVSHAEEIRQQDGIERLYRSVDETEKLKRNDKAIYREGVDLLETESAEDERARRKYGTDRWGRLASAAAVPKLFAQIGEIDGYLQSAEDSDKLVLDKIREQELLIRVLGGTERDLEQYVPSSRRVVMVPAVEKEAGKLRGSLNEISRLESRRRRKIEALRARAKQDDINPELLQEASRLEREHPMQPIEAVQFEGLFEQRLQRYDADKAAVADEEGEQQAVLKRLHETNAAFLLARKGDSSTRSREKVLQSLENAYFKYKEILHNLETGRRFYNDLAKIVTRFRDECRNFAYQRRAEASQAETDMASAMASLNLQQASALHQQRLAAQESAPYAQKAHAEEPMAAPTPTRAAAPPPAAGMWAPEMGIRFGPPPPPPPTAGSKPPQDGRWDPSRGMKFG